MTSEIDKPTFPRLYSDLQTEEGQKRLREYMRVKQEQDAADVEFAKAVDAIVTEGPWENVPAQDVAYVGIDPSGNRVKLTALSAFWRLRPDAGGFMVVNRGGIVVRRVYLGPAMPGVLVGRAEGQTPVQAHGLIDGEEFYFRSRGEHWSMSIGGTAIYQNPRWYYEETYGAWPEAGMISTGQAYEFIAQAATKFRGGVPSMAERTIDRGVASITQAIESLRSDGFPSEE